MKKMLKLFSVIVLIVGMLNGCASDKKNDISLELKELKYEEIADKLIRFHVIANSDSKEDQELKLKVRDRVIDALSVKLKDSETLDEARNLLVQNIDFVNNVAKDVIIENNYNYDIKTTLSNENFPDKIYGDYIFPQGNYEAFRVVIGDGSGQNWWCVMFPPLCFVDETKNSVDSEKLENSINSLKSDEKVNEKKKDEEITSEEIESKDASDEEVEKDGEESSDDKIVFKSKIFKFFDDLFS